MNEWKISKDLEELIELAKAKRDLKAWKGETETCLNCFGPKGNLWNCKFCTHAYEQKPRIKRYQIKKE